MFRFCLYWVAFLNCIPVHSQNSWGILSQGGPGGGGVIFSVNATGANLQVRHAFEGGNPGKYPASQRLLHLNGSVYGVTQRGGTYDNGVLFEYNLSNGAYTSRMDFNSPVSGDQPLASLIVVDDKLFGTTVRGGPLGGGTLFAFDPATGQYTPHHYFNSMVASTGVSPRSLTLAGGKLYGVSMGGSFLHGIIYEYDPVNYVFTKKVDFVGSNGDDPQCTLALGANGKLYGTTTKGGDYDGGTLFEYVPGETSVTKLVDFKDETGTTPVGEMIFAGGKLYGMTAQAGPSGYGSLYMYDPGSGQLEIEYFFDSSGNFNSCSLALSESGLVYGMTTGIGLHSFGTVFEFNPASGLLTFLYHFDNENGRNPLGGFMEMPDGKLYASTEAGGVTDSGVLFSFAPGSNTYTKLIDLQSGTGRPIGQVSMFRGKLYGVTLNGGPSGYGTLFEYDTLTSNLRELTYFTGGNGNQPNGGLVYAGGKSYGITRFGGTTNKGTIFEYDHGVNEFSTVSEFGSIEYPFGLVLPVGDKLIGITSGGTPALYEVSTQSGLLSTRLSLPPMYFASDPSGFIEFNGKFYGTCRTNSLSSEGFIYEYDYSTNSIRELTFLDGLAPTGKPIVLGLKMYFLSKVGALNGLGGIIEFDPITMTYSVLYSFQYGIDGHTPQGALLVGKDGKLYGMTSAGGTDDLGVVFQFDPASQTYSKRSDFSIESGFQPHGAVLFNAGMDPVLNTESRIDNHRIYPNPVSSTLYGDTSAHGISIRDVMNRSVSFAVTHGEKNFSVDVSHLASGIYFLQYTTTKGVNVVRFMKR